MKNKILIVIVAALLLMVLAAQFVSKENVLYSLKFSKSHSTLKEEVSNFALLDASKLDKIMIADKANNMVVLNKKDSGWTVNDKYYARRDGLKNLMEAIERIRVKYPISKAEHNTCIKNLAGNSKKIELYEAGNLIKTYYIGGATQDQMGTYALMENSSVPFVVHIPGFTGFLTPRFISEEAQWRENFVIKADLKDMVSVEVLNSEDSERSFRLTKKEDGSYELLNAQNENMGAVDTNIAKNYFMSFKLLPYEAMVTQMKEDKRDSLIHSKPLQKISLRTKTSEQVAKTHYVLNDNYYNDEGDLLKYDPDRMYCVFNNDKDIATVQYRTFNKITIDPKWLLQQ